MGTTVADHPSLRGWRENKGNRMKDREETNVTRLSALPIYHTPLDFFPLVINSGIGQHTREEKKCGTNKQPLGQGNTM